MISQNQTGIGLAENGKTVEKTYPQPWLRSRPRDQDRDKSIWESREAGNTWEKVAEDANCGITTAKEAYARMKGKSKSVR